MNFSLATRLVAICILFMAVDGRIESMAEKYDGIIQPLSIDGYKIVQGKANVKIFVSISELK